MATAHKVTSPVKRARDDQAQSLEVVVVCCGEPKKSMGWCIPNLCLHMSKHDIRVLQDLRYALHNLRTLLTHRRV